MKKILLSFVICLTFGISGCQHKSNDAACLTDTLCPCCMQPQITIHLTKGCSPKLTDGLVEKLQKEVDNIYGEDTYNVSEGDAIELSDSLLNATGGRYSAIKILNAVNSFSNSDNDVHVVITHKDMAAPLHGKEDYGIMGYSFRPGHSCVVSTYRIKNTATLWKVVLHEFLHSRGVPHCQNEECLMADCKGKGDFSKKKTLCDRCKSMAYAHQSKS